MSEIKIELNSSGIRELLKSPEIEAILSHEADKLASRAGTGYHTDTHQTGGRVVASVYVSDDETLNKEFEHNTLLEAVSR